VQDPMVRYERKNLSFFLFAIEMEVLSDFLWKKGLETLGVKV